MLKYSLGGEILIFSSLLKVHRNSLVFTILFFLSLIIYQNSPADVTSLGLGDDPSESLVDISIKSSVTEIIPGGSFKAALIIDIIPGWHINSNNPHEKFLIPARISFGEIAGLSVSNIDYPTGEDVFLADSKMSVYEKQVTIYFDITTDTSLAIGTYALHVKFDYQPCNDKSCRPPETGEALLNVIVGSNGKAINSELFSKLQNKEQQNIKTATTESNSAQQGSDSELQRLIDKHGIWGYFLALGLAFITGLLLSFSPCTYPMIPITVSIFAGQQRTVWRGFVLSLFYVGSMAIMYGIMGLIVSLVGGVFGAWLASPAVVIGIAIVFVIFSLSMFGLYELNLPMSLRQKLGTKKSGGGIAGSILLGVIAALVISPCVGPFVAGILLYVATAGSPVIGFLILFVFALGLGTLFVLIGTFSSAINALPGSGDWMETVKKFFGFVLLIMAIFFLRTLLDSVIMAILTGLLLVAFGVFGGGFDRLLPEDGFFPRLKKFLGILALLIGIYLLMGVLISRGLIFEPATNWLPTVGNSSGSQSEAKIGWITDLDLGLQEAAQSGKPVLIDTWASWCTNCKVLEKKTLSNPDIVNESLRFVPVKVQLERTNSPESVNFMKHFGLKSYSLPTTILLNKEGKVHRMIQGVIGPKELLNEMKKL